MEFSLGSTPRCRKMFVETLPIAGTIEAQVDYFM